MKRMKRKVVLAIAALAAFAIGLFTTLRSEPASASTPTAVVQQLR
jgi:hypothetical protein